MTRTATLFGKGLMFMRFFTGALIRMTTEAHFPFGLIEEEWMGT